jgi:hypothetical protein
MTTVQPKADRKKELKPVAVGVEFVRAAFFDFATAD